MSQKGKTLVKGHTLLFEGQPLGRRNLGHGCGGTGIGGCSCGAQSPELTSGAERKRWHREHKENVKTESTNPVPAS